MVTERGECRADAVSIASVVPQVVAEHPGLNVVINNAGIMFGDDPVSRSMSSC